jgi:hypothetical protein
MKLLLRRLRSWLRGPTIVPTTPERIKSYLGTDGLGLVFHDLGLGIELTPEGARVLMRKLCEGVILWDMGERLPADAM